MNTPRTPRDLLLARHADAARPALDAQHTALLARFAATSTHATAVPSPLAAFRVVISSLHRELFAPYRRTWATLATAWIAIFAFQQLDRLAASPFSTGRLASNTTASPEAPLLALWLEQRRQLAALAADPAPRPATTRETIPPPAPPRPLGCIAPAPARLALA